MGTDRIYSNRSILAITTGVAAALMIALAVLAPLSATVPIGSGELSFPQDERFAQADLIEEAIATDGEARVMVGLSAPASVSDFVSYGDADSMAELHAEVALLQDAVLSRVEGPGFQLRHTFENIAAFSCIVSLDALHRLLEVPEVETVEAVIELQAHTDQGIPLMQAMAVRAAHDGSGVAIAICDTGVNYNHPKLGNGGFPNAKVIGGTDIAESDSDPIDINGHGSAVAGIAAGDLDTAGDFVGGVAPGAKIYALKVTTGASLNALTDDVAVAWDWCVTHQNDDPANPIRVINNSLGGGRFTEVCNPFFPVLGSAAASAKNAGMSIFASTGNDGYCDAVAVPACLFDTFSVGSVYDADVGFNDFCVETESCSSFPTGGCSTGFGCVDVSSAADQVPCYANMSLDVDILAPSNDARTPALGSSYQNFGGTSAAAPYAAGAAAILQAAHSSVVGGVLDPLQVRVLMEVSGDTISDARSGIDRPRLNVQRAFDSLGAASNCQGIDNVNVITVNGNSGVGTGMSVDVSVNGPLLLEIVKPEAGGNGKFVVHMNSGAPNAGTITPLPAKLGAVCFDLLIPAGASPSAIFNNIGKTNQVGESAYFGSPQPNPDRAPTAFLDRPTGDAGNLPIGSTWTLQGAIINSASTSNKPASVTNAVMFAVQ